MQVIDRGHLNADGDYAEGRSFECLGVSEYGMVRCWGTKWELLIMHEKGPDKGHVDDNYGFLFLTPVGTSKCLEHIDTR